MGLRGRKSKDLTGQRFGRLVALCREENRSLNVCWLCRCDCGEEKTVRKDYLLESRTQSCGCLQSEIARKQFTTHGLSKDKRYLLWAAAKCRAKETNLPFNITVDDIIIPKICPVFGIPLLQGVGVRNGNSPSLDRFEMSAGYVKDNIRVISWRANRLKSDMTLEEARNLLEYLDGKK